MVVGTVVVVVGMAVVVVVVGACGSEVVDVPPGDRSLPRPVSGAEDGVACWMRATPHPASNTAGPTRRMPARRRDLLA
ncbi:MAG: hypothetical protein J2P59_01035 [Acidimicrobiales bacterium]|nr:hypothetical protein [Acidimicrobiales bacterium]MBO0886187.1 hypothetical protein [Acidimicrobiales bacterium]